MPQINQTNKETKQNEETKNKNRRADVWKILVNCTSYSKIFSLLVHFSIKNFEY